MTKKQKNILLAVILLVIFGKWIYLICWTLLEAMTLSVMVLLIVFPPAIPIILLLYIAFMVFTYKVGEKKVTAALLVFMTVFMAFFLYDTGWIPGSHKYYERKLTTMLIGKPYVLFEPVFEHRQHGDSPDSDFSIDVYDLQDNAVKYFTNPATDLSNYPEKPQDLENWNKVSWQQGPSNEALPSILNTILSEKNVATLEPDKARHINWIVQTLSEPTTYYAYFQNRKDSRDVKFYAVDPDERKLISISSIW